MKWCWTLPVVCFYSVLRRLYMPCLLYFLAAPSFKALQFNDSEDVSYLDFSHKVFLEVRVL